MAMLASKAPYPVQTSSSQYPSAYRIPGTMASNHGVPFSPTESEFSEMGDTPDDSVRNWDEDTVSQWLHSINCGHYIDLFRKNNINGLNLMEMDQPTLKEMGVKKVGDRVRIGAQIKQFRNREYKRTSKRSINRDSLATLDNPTHTPPSSGSPRPYHTSRSGISTRSEKRLSRHINGSDLGYPPSASYITKSPSRPSSPFVDQDSRGGLRSGRYGGMTPKDSLSRTNLPSSSSLSFGQPPSSASTVFSKSSNSSVPLETPQTARFASQSGNSPHSARFGGHSRASPSMDVTNSSVLPSEKALIRAIFDDGRSSVVSIEGCRSAEDIILKTLRKGALNEAHVKSYCFYLLDGVEPDPKYCRRLTDTELLRICTNRQGNERGRLILRKIHTGEPEEEQLRAAAGIAAQQQAQPTTSLPSTNMGRAPLKIERVMGESLPALSYPISPASAAERERHVNSAAQDLERADSVSTSTSIRARKLKDFYGARPPSELITSDLTSYFPEVAKDEIEKTVRLSVRRSKRLSKAQNRLSTASNFSFASSLRDAPPIPSIADTWLQGGNQRAALRPLSVLRLGGRPVSNYRDSFASSVLDPLPEEASPEPDRRSYVSIGDESSCESTANVAVTDPDGNITLQSYYDDAGSSPSGTDAGGSMNQRLSQMIVEDSEESDEEFVSYLQQDSWEGVKYMKGALIGQGSFGSVYLALHAVTGELMAVKQVEMPSTNGGPLDAKKNSMIEALKHEISLLRDLKHPNIVQYLGSNSDDAHLNIFLEYVPGGSVATMLVNYGPLGEGLISNFVRQILVGLAYLHSKDIIHRDIKGANILVDNKGSVKISDFGISKRVEASSLLSTTPGQLGKKGNPRVSLQGSVFWMAPEVVKQTAYTRKADIWSLGCLVVEMFTGSHPHPNCTQLQAIFKIGGSGDAKPDLPDVASEEAKGFLKRTFEIDHERRPTAEELLLSGWLMRGEA